MTQGTLHPGLLPQLLGELHLGRKSGFLRLAKGEETVDLDLNEGGILRVCGIRGRESLIEAFSWGAGKYVFMEGPAASPDDEQALDLGLSLVLRDGLGNGAADAVTHVLGDLDCLLFLHDEDRRALVSTATDHIILGRVDGTRSIRKIIEQVPLPAEETQRSLAVLLCTGVLQTRSALLAVVAAVEPNAPEEIPAPRAVVLEEDEEAGEVAEADGAAAAAEVTAAAEPAVAAVEAAAAEVAESAPATESASATESAAPTELAAETESAQAAESAAAIESAEAAATAEAAAEPSAPEVSVAPATSPAPATVLEVEGEAAVEPKAPELAPAPLAVALEEVVEEALKAVEAVEAAEAAVQPNRPQSPVTAAPLAPPASVPEVRAPETVAAPRRDSAGDVQERLDDRILLEVLGIGKGEMPVDLMDNALVADDVIRRATNMMAGSDPFGAIRLLEAVIPRIYVKELKREAQVVLARGYTRNPKWVRRGEEMLQSVIREDPSFVDAYLALGTLYKENGLRARAVNMFRKVLELRPDHNLAAAEVRSLITPAPSKKLFGRT